ncbi:hypothetical protein HK27_08880 [Acetobacter orientalis]|nr:hypothetical protein HK27_08880 [Acetobacter orientalis]
MLRYLGKEAAFTNQNRTTPDQVTDLWRTPLSANNFILFEGYFIASGTLCPPSTRQVLSQIQRAPLKHIALHRCCAGYRHATFKNYWHNALPQ